MDLLGNPHGCQGAVECSAENPHGRNFDGARGSEVPGTASVGVVRSQSSATPVVFWTSVRDIMESPSGTSHQTRRRSVRMDFAQHRTRRGHDGCISYGVPRDDGLLRKFLNARVGSEFQKRRTWGSDFAEEQKSCFGPSVTFRLIIRRTPYAVSECLMLPLQTPNLPRELQDQ